MASPLLALPSDVLLLVCSFLSPRTRLLHLGPVCRHLRSLALRSITAYRSPVHPALASQMPNLRSLTSASQMAADDVRAVAPRITSLTIASAFPMDTLPSFTNLTALTQKYGLRPNAAQALMPLNASTLTSLHMRFVEEPRAAPPLPALRSLTLTSRADLDFADFRKYAPWIAALTHLHFAAPEGPQQEALCAAFAPHLRTLHVKIRPEAATPPLVAWILRHTSVTALSLRLKDFTAEHWPLLAGATSSLTALGLADCPTDVPRLTDLLARCTKFRMLRFHPPGDSALDPLPPSVTRPELHLLQHLGGRLESIGNTLLHIDDPNLLCHCRNLTRLAILASQGLEGAWRVPLLSLRKLHIHTLPRGKLTAALCVVQRALEACPSLTAINIRLSVSGPKARSGSVPY